MERYFKRKSDVISPAQNERSKQNRVSVEISLVDLPSDPALRTRILDYHPNVRDQVRREYLQRGPCQPKNHEFPFIKCGVATRRRFIKDWFDQYPNWLEYSIDVNRAFCLCCYLFKTNSGEQAGGDTFTRKGFENWKKKERFEIHVGDHNSAHNQALKMCETLMNENQHIRNIMHKNVDQSRIDYRIRLSASIDCIRFLLRQGLAFRGHDESDCSRNQGNFLELLQFLADHDEKVRAVALKNAPENLKLTSPMIQKDIVNAAVVETINAIIKDMGDSFFSILVDEARDASVKEQMAVIFRYVNNSGCVIESFVGIKHVANTTAISLKQAIDALICKLGLSMSSLRGQGYDGANNMSGVLNGLKTLILKNSSAFYVYCFAHQLELSLVAVANKHDIVGAFFNTVARVVNIVGASSKRRDILLEKQALTVVQALSCGELSTGRGLNQDIEIKRSCDTRWSSHYGTLLNFSAMFSSIIDVLSEIAFDSIGCDQKHEAFILLGLLQSFDFMFSLHLMRIILGITHELSQALQRDDQDIVNAMDLVKICKRKLQDMRENGWDCLLEQVEMLCDKEKIAVPTMSDQYLPPQWKSKRNRQEMTNMHFYRFDFFCAVIDFQLQELNNRFNEGNTELLICLASLSLNECFAFSDKKTLMQLARFYPNDFSTVELLVLETQLEIYINDMQSNTKFQELQGITNLAIKLVETGKHKTYPYVYLLIRLALVLPVATAFVERAFSAISIIKNRLCNRMGDRWLNDSLTVYLEKDVFNDIKNESIIQRFQNMAPRWGQL